MRRITTTVVYVTIAVFGWTLSAGAQQSFTMVCPTNYLQAPQSGFNPFDGPRPVVVMLQDHFSTDVVLGGATPLAVLYENGQLIVQNRQEKGIVYWSQHLAPAELSQFKRRIAPIFEIEGLKNQYDLLPNTTSRPRTCFLFRDGKRQVVVEIRGLTLPHTELEAELYHGLPPDKPPPQLVEIHRFLGSLDQGQAPEWQPNYIEVLLWSPRRKLTEGAAIWPATWPTLRSDRAFPVRDRLRSEVYSIILDGGLLSGVRNLLNENATAVNLADRSWMFAYRHVFPGEPEWREPFNRTLISHLGRKED